ncbi:hypothetical protein [Parapedobacter tibetensis]|uniref:hypothetical protein n=1 Tax=Parapedobacter tibetensis TaxID=2972951 RepID=UPI00214DC062|nr:hypothetical protein [Parapedobacter tibetensis]
MAWFQLNPNGNPTLSSDYGPASPSQPSCPGVGNICSISADEDASGRPVITESLRDAMLIALSSGVESGNVLLRNTP